MARAFFDLGLAVFRNGFGEKKERRCVSLATFWG